MNADERGAGPRFAAPSEGAERSARCVIARSLRRSNLLLYEAFAQADDPRIMVVSLDLLDNLDLALSGHERHFLVFNPLDEPRTVRLRFRPMAEGRVTATVSGQDARTLDEDLELHLPAMGSLRLTLEHEDAAQEREAVQSWRDAQRRLAHAYQRLQGTARDHGIDEALQSLKARYLDALEHYAQGAYDRAVQEAADAVEELAKPVAPSRIN